MDFFFGNMGPAFFGGATYTTTTATGGGGIPHPTGAPTQTPPASRAVINGLKQLKVTADDLIKATNRECTICLEEQTLGSYACKLQCGHLYHLPCLKEWLEKHCTCPICRFELPTDDVMYEQERKKRVKTRRPRFRLDELQSKKCRN